MNEREELFAEKLQSQGWLSNEQAYDLHFSAAQGWKVEEVLSVKPDETAKKAL